jgi:hypothetical protein
MDYYQSVVVDYLRADRALFINTEYCIQLREGNPDMCGPHSHWYCDVVVVEFGSSAVFLGECSYAAGLQGLVERLKYWNENWQGVCDALARDSRLSPEWKWTVRPWLFVPRDFLGKLEEGLKRITGGEPLNFLPRVTSLEMVQPWKYSSYDRRGENMKHKEQDGIPPEWRK